MKKTIMIAAMLLATAGSLQAENKLTAGDVTLANGEPAELVISMDNDIEVGAYDFHLYLPEGIALVYDTEEEDYVYELSARHNKKHQLTILYDETDGSYMFGVADPSLHKVKENSGELMTILLTATDDAVPGTYQGSIRKIWLAESGSSGVDVADTYFSIVVSDYTAGINDMVTAKKPSHCYTLHGQRVTAPRRGIYIKDGRKLTAPRKGAP